MLVGDIIRLEEDHEVPCDAVVLSTSDANGLCYIQVCASATIRWLCFCASSFGWLLIWEFLKKKLHDMQWEWPSCSLRSLHVCAAPSVITFADNKPGWREQPENPCCIERN